jgi:hypothetical protein
MINWKGYGRTLSWPNFTLVSWHSPEGLREITKNLSRDSRSPDRDLKPRLPEYEAGVLTTQPRRSVILVRNNKSPW